MATAPAMTEETRARELHAITVRLADLDLHRQYDAGFGMICRGCGKPIGHVDALVYRALTIMPDVATHATYPCTRRWLAFDEKSERFTDEGT